MSMTMREFVKDAKISIAFEQVSSNPNMASDSWSHSARHYKVVLRKWGTGPSGSVGSRRFTTYFSKGPGLPHGVEAHEVISALASDSASVESASSEYDWGEEMGMFTHEDFNAVRNLRSRRQAEEYGYEKEWDAVQRSRKTFAIIQRQTAKLRDFLGSYHAGILFGGEVEFD